MSITLTSTAFSEGGPIPSDYTCDGADISPPLAWSDIPDATQSFALIADDPDAARGTWVQRNTASTLVYSPQRWLI